MSENLFAEFPPVSTAEWRAQVEKDLRGADFERKLVVTNLDGIRVAPFHRFEDIATESCSALKATAGWKLREEVRDPDLADANAHMRRALTRGVDQLSVLSYPIGPFAKDLAEFRRLTEAVLDQGASLHWQCGPLSGHQLTLLRGCGTDLSNSAGGLDLDPLMDRCAGWTDAEFDTWADEARSRIHEVSTHFFKFDLLAIRGVMFEKAGASICQELAYTLALFSEYLVALAEGEIPLNELVGRSEIRLAVGTSYFFEVAKLRALRKLLPSFLEAHGVQGVMPSIHVVSTSSNKTVYDATNNLLRGTVEAMAMAVGGADTITVAAYDQAYGTPDEFSEHLSRNTQTLLSTEAHLHEVADPLAGSYTVEWLTQAYVTKAWEKLRAIEAQGGFVAAWKSGAVEKDILAVQAARAQQVRTRRRVIVGTTAFGNPQERRLSDVRDSVTPRVVKSQSSGPDDLFTTRPVPSTALNPFRVSWPYEHLRLRTERSGRRPHVRLALFGEPTMRHARAGFCQGLLAAGGYEVSEQVVDRPADVDTQGVDLVVLCADDASYLSAVQNGLPIKPTMVAGYPETDVEALKAAGIVGFLHIRQPIDEALEGLHARLGVPAFGPQPQEALV